MAPGGAGDQGPPPRPGLLFLLLLGLPGLLEAAPAGSPASEPLEGVPAGLSCVAPAPSLAWILEEEGEEGRRGGGGGGRRLGPGLLRTRRLERTLRNCSSAARPEPTSVLLELHVQPELLQMEEEASGEDRGDPVLVLLVLVEARPPAHIAWTAPDGGRLAEATSASRFLIAGERTLPWPPDGPLRLRLQLRLGSRGSDGPPTADASLRLPGEEGEGGRPGPRGPGATDAAPAASASLAPALLGPWAGLLSGRVELPLVALVAGSAGALGACLALAALLGCLLGRRRRRRTRATKAAAFAAAAGPPFLVPGPPREPSPTKARMPRAPLSLPANLRLQSLGGAAEEAPGPAPSHEEEQRALSEPEDGRGPALPGLGRFPMVGYIYRASSMSSDEIWL